MRTYSKGLCITSLPFTGDSLAKQVHEQAPVWDYSQSMSLISSHLSSSVGAELMVDSMVWVVLPNFQLINHEVWVVDSISMFIV